VNATETRVAADCLAAELSCEVTPAPARPGVVVARRPLPSIWMLVGTPAEIRAEVRRHGLQAWLAVLGRQGTTVSAPLKRRAVIRLVRQRIADGTLRPGSPAPSGGSLARELDCNPLTARRALQLLVADGTLVPGPSRCGADPAGAGG
jgi:hypothetical protein